MIAYLFWEFMNIPISIPTSGIAQIYETFPALQIYLHFTEKAVTLGKLNEKYGKQDD